MKLEALLFDVDGTLADTEELHRQSFNQTFLDFGFGWNWDPELYQDLLQVSGGADRIARYLDIIDLSAAEKTRLRRLIPAIHREKTSTYGELMRGNSVRLRPGVARLVEEARQAGVRIGLAATSASANVQALIATAFGRDAQRAIHAVVCADQVARKKPAPDIYEHLLTMLRTPAAGGVAFEDSANGLAAAKGAGLFTVVTPTRWTMKQKFIGADLVIPTLGDPGHPIDPAVASRVGQPYLELAALEALRFSVRPALQLREAGS